MRNGTTEKAFIDEYCDGCGDGPYYRDDLVNAYRAGRRYIMKSLFIDASHIPTCDTSRIVVAFVLGDEFPFCGEYEFHVIKGYEYEEYVSRSPYKAVWWFKLDSLLNIINRGRRKK